MGIQSRLWRVIRNIYNVNQSCVYLDGIKSEYFGIPDFVGGLIKEIESRALFLPSLKLKGLLFADDFVGKVIQRKDYRI